MSVAVVFETHSLSEDNELGRATGWLDGRLSARGKVLAAELGERRRGDGLGVVFTSDLGRAVETAEIAFARSGPPIVADRRLRECNYGVLNGAPRSRLDEVGSRGLDEPFPEGESWREAVERVIGFYHELARTRDGERVLVIGHMATWYALEVAAAGRSLEDVFFAPFEWREGWVYTLPATGAARG